MAEQSESDGWIQIAADYEARLTKVEIDRNMLVKALEKIVAEGGRTGYGKIALVRTAKAALNAVVGGARHD